MRIAISGSHATGKSTLIAELVPHLPGVAVIEESYFALLAEHIEFADPPDAADYERMCEHACESLARSYGADTLFDRTPADYLGYLVARGGAPPEPALLSRVREAVATLDLVAFVPIEHPDRIEGAELPRLRRAVDHTLRELWLEDAWGWGIPSIEVHGSPRERVRQVLEWLSTRAESTPSRSPA